MALVIASVFATHALLGINTDTDHMFSTQLPWRRRSIAFEREFPQIGNTLDETVLAHVRELVTAQCAKFPVYA